MYHTTAEGLESPSLNMDHRGSNPPLTARVNAAQRREESAEQKPNWCWSAGFMPIPVEAGNFQSSAAPVPRFRWAYTAAITQVTRVSLGLELGVII